MTKEPSTLIPHLLPLARADLNEQMRHDLANAMDAWPEAESLLDWVAAHGLMPLAYRHLVAHHEVAIRTEVAGTLSSVFQRHAVSRFRVARRLKEILEALEEAGVPVRPYKGPVLAAQLYGSFALRQYGDIDILVHPDNVMDAARVLDGIGVVNMQRFTPEWDRYLRGARHDYALRDRKTGTLVELHWALADGYHGIRVDPDWLFAAPVAFDYFGLRIHILGPERQVLALCVHGGKHHWERLSWLAEVAELIRQHPEIDWSVVFEEAHRAHCVRLLRASLLLVEDLFGDVLPDPWGSMLKADRDAQRVSHAWKQALGADAAEHYGHVDHFFRSWRMRDSRADRFRFLWRVLTEPSERDIAGRHVPRSLRSLYLLVRPWRLMFKGLAQKRGNARVR